MKGEEHTAAQDREEPGKRPPWWRRLWAWTGFADKQFWDWLQLLSAWAIPIALAVAGFWFTSQQDERQENIEEQRAQDAALQAYLDQMGHLMLEKDLRNSDEDSEVRTLARARTLTVLGRSDRSRKTEVMRFLIEADLVQRIDGSGPIIGLGGAELGDAELGGADLSGADLSGANLQLADLSDTDLTGADLTGVTGVTNEQLRDQAWSLDRVTMPDGSYLP